MEKEKYMKATVEVISFDNEDIITTSNPELNDKSLYDEEIEDAI